MEEVSPETTFGIVISYRSDDVGSDDARRLHGCLVGRFGEGAVSCFPDTFPAGAFPPGTDVIVAIARWSANCDVLLPTIGPHWLTVTDENGRRRLDDPKDIVRVGIEAALDAGVRIIPILLHGAQMPNSGDLPESLAGLARRNAISIDSPHQIETVTRAIEEIRLGKPHGGASDEELVMYSLPEPEAPPRRRGVRGWFHRERSLKASAPSEPESPVMVILRRSSGRHRRSRSRGTPLNAPCTRRA